MFKKILSLALVVVMCGACLAMTACTPADTAETSYELAPVAKDEIKVGFIFLHDENSTYDKNFIDAAKATVTALGLKDDQVFYKTNVPEDNTCYEAAADLVAKGCDVIFADSFGHEDFIIQAAIEFPNVQFCHATGTKAHTSTLPNYHNAFASIYEGRFVAGVVAGIKLNEMIENGEITAEEAKIGYVGAWPYAEVISGYTSFFLGARSVCPTATMTVKYTNSWYDEAKEKEAANALINTEKCVLISQHADSMGAPTACEKAGVPNVSYNGSTKASCPNTYLISSKINWAPYFDMMINSVINGVRITEEYCGGFAEGSVQLTELNADVLPEGTQEIVDATIADLMAGKIKVFDTDTFTVDGKKLEECMADVNSDASFTADTQVVLNGFFNESTFRSAPYFDKIIDGITVPEN